MRRRRSLGGGFSPRKLFAGSLAGAWYDPSDFSTLFQDSAGTTPVTAVEQSVGRILDKSGNNNHALQATSLSRPVLKARYNILLATETLATQSVTTIAKTYKLSFTGAGSITLTGTATGVYSAGTNTITCTAGSLTLTVVGSVTQADLRLSSTSTTMPAYQRVTTSTNYETTGFLPYLSFDGSDDRIFATITSQDYINNTVAFGLLLDATAVSAVIGNIGNSASGNSFYNIAAQSGTSDWGFAHRNDAGTTVSNYAAGSSAGTPYIVIGRAATSASAMRINNTITAGTAVSGVLTANMFNLGSLARSSLSAFSNVRLYSAVFLRESLSTANEAKLAAWMATKTGVTL